MEKLIEWTPQGLYCKKGDFHIDPWRPVKKAVITHAHGDHARSGSETYYCASPGERILRHRVGKAEFVGVEYGQRFSMGSVQVSFHPAGHILGSAQVRIDDGKQVWVFSGDYKRDYDPTCTLFEPVVCDVFITESTFGLPIYQWEPGCEVASQVLKWWKSCEDNGEAALLFCYSLGKAQRLMAELSRLTEKEVLVHGAVAALNQIYVDEKVPIGAYRALEASEKGKELLGRLVLAPPAVFGSAWIKRFPSFSAGFASGWMQVRGNRRRQGYDRGFVLSDHADWSSLLKTIEDTQAKTIYITHGDSQTLSRYLQERGVHALPLKTEFEPEGETT